MNDESRGSYYEWRKQKMSDEGRRSYYEGWMMKAEDHIMNDKNGRQMMNDERSYYEGWEMMKTEDHIMNNEWWMQKIYVQRINDRSRRSSSERCIMKAEDHKIILWMMKAEDHPVNDKWWKQKILRSYCEW